MAQWRRHLLAPQSNDQEGNEAGGQQTDDAQQYRIDGADGPEQSLGPGLVNKNGSRLRIRTVNDAQFQPLGAVPRRLPQVLIGLLLT